MSDFRRVTDSFFVTPQIRDADIPAAAAKGFKVLIANRPDGEDPGQMPSADVRLAAEAAGLSFLSIPVRGAPGPEAVAQTAAAIAEAEGPILAYCRSGTRSVTLWAFATAQSGVMSTAEIIAAAKGAGYDLSAHARALDAART